MLVWFLIFTFGSTLAGFGILNWRKLDQQIMNQHTEFRMTYPRKLQESEPVLFIDSLAGLFAHEKPHSLRGRQYVAIRSLGLPDGIHQSISLPHEFSDIFLNHALSTIPGVGVEEIAPQPHKWQFGMELFYAPPSEGSADYEPVKPDKIAVLLSALSGLEAGDAVMVELLLLPTGGKGFRSVIRLVASAPSPIRAHELLKRVKVAYGSLHVFPGRVLTKRELRNVDDRLAPVIRWPSILEALPVVVLSGIPVGSPTIPGISYGRGQRLMAEAGTPDGPIALGTSNYPGIARYIGVSPADLTKHQHVIGNQGMGKSSFLVNQMLQWIRLGYGLMFIDPHGDAAQELVDSVPGHRIKDIVFLDFTRSESPVGLNLLEGDPERVTSQMMAVFDAMYDIGRLAIAPNILRAACLALAYNKMAFTDLGAFLQPTNGGRRLREHLAKRVPNERVRASIQEINAMENAKFAVEVRPLLRRLEVFQTWPSLWGSLGQTESSFNFDDVLATKKIVIVHLSMSDEFKEPSSIIGSLLLGRFISAARRRDQIAVAERTPFGLYVDEVQNFLSTTVSLATVLDEMRKFGIAFTLAHQRMDQLSPDMRSAVSSNARNKAFFKVSASDAAVLSRELPEVTPDHILGLDRFEAIIRLVSEERDMRATSINVLPKAEALGHARAVRVASQLTYGTPLATVEAQMRERVRLSWEEPPEATIGERDF